MMFISFFWNSDDMLSPTSKSKVHKSLNYEKILREFSGPTKLPCFLPLDKQNGRNHQEHHATNHWANDNHETIFKRHFRDRFRSLITILFFFLFGNQLLGYLLGGVAGFVTNAGFRQSLEVLFPVVLQVSQKFD